MADDRLWYLKDHESASGHREVRDHYDGASETLQAAFDVHWDYLRVRSRDQWVRPKAHKLRPEEKGGFRDFFEFRFREEGTQQRPLGYFLDGSKHFILLIWAIEKGSKFVPTEAVKICNKRRDAILKLTAKPAHWSDEENDEDDKT